MKNKLKLISLMMLTVLLVAVLFSSCGNGLETDTATETETETEVVEYIPTHYATIEIRDYGTIKLELYGNLAPITVENFVNLAKEGLYEGLTFHRIITGFMIQGGGFDVSGNEMDVPSITGEFASNGIKNPIKHVRGVISMARADAKDSASSQFFIMHEAAPHLDGDYAAFGKVISGIEVVDEICKNVPQGNNGAVSVSNRPVIDSVTIEDVE